VEAHKPTLVDEVGVSHPEAGHVDGEEPASAEESRRTIGVI
jgi:hypothetical protein